MTDSKPPKADPEIGKQAIEDAKRIKREREAAGRAFPKAQKIMDGKNTHHPKDQIISEFDDPAANKV